MYISYVKSPSKLGVSLKHREFCLTLLTWTYLDPCEIPDAMGSKSVQVLLVLSNYVPKRCICNCIYIYVYIHVVIENFVAPNSNHLLALSHN